MKRKEAKKSAAKQIPSLRSGKFFPEQPEDPSHKSRDIWDQEKNARYEL
jgi:hypothetical protein